MACVYITKQTSRLILIMASYPPDFTTVPCIISKVKEKNESGEEEEGQRHTERDEGK